MNIEELQKLSLTMLFGILNAGLVSASQNSTSSTGPNQETPGVFVWRDEIPAKPSQKEFKEFREAYGKILKKRGKRSRQEYLQSRIPHVPVQINPRPQAMRPTYQRQPSEREIQAVENRINDIENNMKAHGPNVSHVADLSSYIIDEFSDFEYKDLPSADSSESVCLRLYNLFLKEFDRNHMEDFVKKLETNGVRCHRSIE